MVDATAEVMTEPERERRARPMCDVGDPVEAHPVQMRDQRLRKPQRRQRQSCDGGVDGVGRDHTVRASEADHGMGGAIGRTDRGVGFNAFLLQA